MSDTTTILLVRHGMNDYVKAHRFAGWAPGVHLNELGTSQAQAAAERLSVAPIKAVYSSPLDRTMETAGPIAERHGLTVNPMRELGELDPGDWTGETIDQCRETELWRQIQIAPSLVTFPGGESYIEAQWRMVRSLEKLRVEHAGETIVVVSHSDPIKLTIAFYTGLPLDHYQRLIIGPASISELAFTPMGPRLVRTNDRAHLPIEQPEPPAETAAEASAADDAPRASDADGVPQASAALPNEEDHATHPSRRTNE